MKRLMTGIVMLGALLIGSAAYAENTSSTRYTCTCTKSAGCGDGYIGGNYKQVTPNIPPKDSSIMPGLNEYVDSQTYSKLIKTPNHTEKSKESGWECVG